MTTQKISNTLSTSANSALKTPNTVPQNNSCLGWALRLQPTSEYCFNESASLELQHILRHNPHALLTVLTLYRCTFYGGNTTNSQLRWEDQDVQISVSYRCPPLFDAPDNTAAMDALQESIHDDQQSVLAWARHAHWHVSSLLWEKTLQTAREWETVSTFHHPPTQQNEIYQLASCAPTTTQSTKLRITNRVWWDDVSQCFMVTECSYHDFSSAPNYQSDPLTMSNQLMRNHCPCRSWALPTPCSSILIGVTDSGEPASINLQFGNRMAMLHTYDDTTATWHPLLFNTCLRAAAAGLRAYVVTHTPEPWIKLRTYVGRQQLTFLEEAHEDHYPRQLLFWDCPEPPPYDILNRYSSVGTVVWTRAEKVSQCATLFPTYVVECHWPETPQHHIEQYTGTLHRHGETLPIRCVADHPQ